MDVCTILVRPCRAPFSYTIMSIEDTIGYLNDSPTCVVCGKGVEGSRGFARFKHGGIMVNLCCPGCIDTFEKDPLPHMARLQKVAKYRKLHNQVNKCNVNEIHPY